MHEPVERVAIDVPEDYVGVVTQLLALRKGRMQQMVNHGTGWARMEYLVPARGLIGFRTEFLTRRAAPGSCTTSSRLGAVVRRAAHAADGSLVADRRGAGDGLRDREPAGARLALHRADGRALRGDDRRRELAHDDLDVNASKPKKLTNMRASSADNLSA